MTALLYTQVHCLHNGQVLLMRRNKEPNLGLWVAPGGKIEADESPHECATRELLEETSLRAHEVHLRGIASVVMPKQTQPQIQFLYVVTSFSDEGEQCWLGGVIGPGETLRVWTLQRDQGKGGYNCGFGEEMWNDAEPDTAVLFDADGREVDRYPKPGAGTATRPYVVS